MFEAACGRRQLGKTTLVYSRAITSLRKIIIWDGRASTSDFHAAEGRTLYGAGGLSLDRWPGSLAAAWSTSREVVIRPPRQPEPEDIWAWFTEQLADHLEAQPADRWTLIVDEYGQVERDWPMRDWNFLVRSVRRAHVDIFVTCHKPVDVPPKQRSLVDRWFIFQTVDPADLEMLKRRSVPADVLAQLPTLPPFVFYEWDESLGRGTFQHDAAYWHVPLTPPVISAERRALFTLRKGNR